MVLTVYLAKISTGVPLICQIREQPKFLSRGQTPNHYFQCLHALSAICSEVCSSNLTSTLEKENEVINVYRYNNMETDKFFILTLRKELLTFQKHSTFFS